MKSDKKFHVGPRGDREIAIVRTFDAPRELVYEAWTRPELVKRWLGAFGGWQLDVCEMDLREGGAYRWVWKNPERNKTMGAGGVFREITAPARIVMTQRFDDPWFEGEALITTTFDEKDGRTTLTELCRYETTAIRDGVLRSPMESGVEAGYDALAKLVGSE
jgi:uncharacterized protein YndB with AHSA1/START domain